MVRCRRRTHRTDEASGAGANPPHEDSDAEASSEPAHQGARFLVVSLAALAVNELWLNLFVALGAGKLVAQAAACILVIPVSFGGNKLWAFRQPSHRRGEALGDGKQLSAAQASRA